MLADLLIPLLKEPNYHHCGGKLKSSYEFRTIKNSVLDKLTDTELGQKMSGSSGNLFTVKNQPAENSARY